MIPDSGDHSQADPRSAQVASLRVLATAYGAFILLGWTTALVPSLVRVIEGEFGQDDAGIGFLFLLNALFYAGGAFVSGLLAARIGRRALLAGSALVIAVGLLTESLSQSWPMMLVGVSICGVGAGAIDAGVNGVIMDVAALGRGSALSRLHLFFSVGALAAPLVIGTIVSAGLGWRVVVGATALIAVVIALPIRAVGAVPPRRRPAVAAAGRTAAADLRRPLAILGIAIACAVAVEMGVSSWIVGFLAAEPMSVATLGLGLFWVGHASGRLVAARVADRFPPVAFAAACLLMSAAALAAAVVGPRGALQLVLFAVVGFGNGPSYPMIMTVAATLYPHRAAAISGYLTAAGIAGSVVYPPLMGFLSGSAGLGAGMLGASLLAVVSGVAVIVAGRGANRSRTPAVAPTGPVGR